jgi:hypothetical protein
MGGVLICNLAEKRCAVHDQGWVATSLQYTNKLCLLGRALLAYCAPHAFLTPRQSTTANLTAKSLQVVSEQAPRALGFTAL